jgi:hypothetical protein
MSKYTPPVSITNKEEISAKLLGYTDPRRELVRRLDHLQGELHNLNAAPSYVKFKKEEREKSWGRGMEM